MPIPSWMAQGLLIVALVVNISAALANCWSIRRCQRRTAALLQLGAEWTAQAERLDICAATVRRLLAEDAPAVVILATLDAEREALS